MMGFVESIVSLSVTEPKKDLQASKRNVAWQWRFWANPAPAG